MAETPYTETEILLAVLENDNKRARYLCEQMTKREKVEFYDALAVCKQTLQRTSDWLADD